MADDTKLIFAEQAAGLPTSYELPPGFDLTVSSIVARIEGSGAAGTFRPALAIYSQSGQLMARAPVDVDFAVGDDGIVTWAPFLRARQTSGPGTSPLTTKGDIYGFDSADARIPVGGDGEVLIADSGEALGVKWDSVPAAAATIQFIGGIATTDLAAAPTAIDYAATMGFEDGTYFDFDINGDLRILAAGVYQLIWWSRVWVLGANVATSWEVFADVVSGSNGQWSPQAAGMGAGTAFASVLGRAEDGSGMDTGGVAPTPDMLVVAGWDTSDTFPVIIRTFYEHFINAVSTAITQPTFGLHVTRLGNAFE